MGLENPFKGREGGKEPEPRDIEELERVSRRLEEMNESLGYGQGDLSELPEKAALELRRVVEEVTKSE